MRESGTADPYATQLKVVLVVWTWHFISPTYWRQDLLAKMGGHIMKVLDRTLQPEVRQKIGGDGKVWNDFVSLLQAAIPSLENRSFAAPDNTSVDQVSDYLGPSGEHIAKNSASLLEDLERLDIVVSIGRNVLQNGEKTQNLVLGTQFHRDIFRLIGVCVRITARGYDGEAGTVAEQKWQKVVNAYKKLLITCLQFLNNLIAGNERLKLTLWIELFNAPTEGLTKPVPTDSGLPALLPLNPEEQAQAAREEMEKMTQIRNSFHIRELPPMTSIEQSIFIDPQDGTTANGRPKPPLTSFFYFVQDQRLKAGDEEAVALDVDWVTNKWNSMTEAEKEPWRTVYAEAREKYLEDMRNWNVSNGLPPDEPDCELIGTMKGVRMVVERNSFLDENGVRRWMTDPEVRGPVEQVFQFTTSEDESAETSSDEQNGDALVPVNGTHGAMLPALAYPYHPDPNGSGTSVSSLALQTDYRITTTATAGAQVLQDGKDQLMKRLHTSPQDQPEPRQGQQVGQIESPSSPVNEDASDGVADEALDEESGEEEESEDDDDYDVSGEDGRGLLTDIPLILGPNEIEYLPMIIMSSIVPPPSAVQSRGIDSAENNAIVNMHTVRCHLLLAQENGRNLLRELLIFVAAWDLRDDELYFKFMIKIMEAILANGLMPFAYDAFRESKDIISPAQAVLLKLLTSIFRARQTRTVPQHAGNETTCTKVQAPDTEYPLRVDVLIVSYLFTEFRQNIIPQTCALMFLQGQIRAGHASPEDFPLNLWDMERMYEGVYQYLEFFAILTEHDVWKRMMADWEITSELVTLLKELDAAIPKTAPPSVPYRPYLPVQSMQQAETPDPVPAPVAVERPYDVFSPEPDSMPSIPNVPAQPLEDPSLSNAAPDMPELTEEPSDFEWRNLKKLAVLVLSSLVWKNDVVQEQVRRFGGLEALVDCCGDDVNNLNIKEHAIMCLRLAVEGNEEAERTVRGWVRNHQEGRENAVRAEVSRGDVSGLQGILEERRREREEAAAAGGGGTTGVTGSLVKSRREDEGWPGGFDEQTLDVENYFQSFRDTMEQQPGPYGPGAEKDMTSRTRPGWALRAHKEEVWERRAFESDGEVSESYGDLVVNGGPSVFAWW